MSTRLCSTVEKMRDSWGAFVMSHERDVKTLAQAVVAFGVTSIFLLLMH
jgi:hypothetical protein